MNKLILTILLISSFSAFAQQKISGIVVDKKQTPINNAQVTETATNNIVYTNQEGKFELSVPQIPYILSIKTKGRPILQTPDLKEQEVEISIQGNKRPFTIAREVVLTNSLPATPQELNKIKVTFTGKKGTPQADSKAITDIDPRYELVTERYEIEPASTRLIVASPKYETTIEQYEIEPASTRLVVVPAVYETVTEQVLERAGCGMAPLRDKDGELIKTEEVPAVYKTITKRIIVSPATTYSEEVPAKYGTRTVKRVTSCSSTCSIEIPAKYGTRSVKRLVTPASARTKSTSTSTRTQAYPPVGNLSSSDFQPIVKTPTYQFEKPSMANTLSATEINDFSKWNLWDDVSRDKLSKYERVWKMELKERYCVLVKNENDGPVVGADVHILDKNDQVLWSARTDNTGKAELWPNIYSQENKVQKIKIEVEGESFTRKRIKPFEKGINVVKLPIECVLADKSIDIAFVVDATASMKDEINYIKDELVSIVGQTNKALPDYSINLGSVFYYDIDVPGELMFAKDFTSDALDMYQFINKQKTKGGRTTPEAVDQALEKAMRLNWREEASTKLLFLFLDAPPHDKPWHFERIQTAIRKAAEKGVRIIPVGCSGTDKSTEYLMRAFALATNGSYVHLTDDSGVGKAHSRPTTDKINKDLLNKILVRQITNFSKIEDCQPDMEELVAALKIETEELTKKTSPDKIDWSYYPNPTSGHVTLTSKEKIGWIHVLDNNGKLLKRHVPKETGAIRLNIKEFPSGMYLLQVFFENGRMETGKVVLTD